MKRALLPLIIFLVVVGFLFKGLFLDPREVPSPLVGKPAPQFSLTRLDAADKTFSPKEMLGKVWLLNAWESWCAACKDEHQLLVELSKADFVPIVGFDYKDNNQDAQQWFDQAEHPYGINAVDAEGRLGIA